MLIFNKLHISSSFFIQIPSRETTSFTMSTCRFVLFSRGIDSSSFPPIVSSGPDFGSVNHRDPTEMKSGAAEVKNVNKNKYVYIYIWFCKVTITLKYRFNIYIYMYPTATTRTEQFAATYTTMSGSKQTKLRKYDLALHHSESFLPHTWGRIQHDTAFLQRNNLFGLEHWASSLRNSL